MKSFLFSVILLLFCCAVYSQSGTHCLSPLFCSSDLRDTFFARKDVDTKSYKYANPNGMLATFHDVAYQSSLSACTKANACLNDASALKYVAYYPSARAYDYKTCRLPMILFFHAGSFADCNGSFNDAEMRTMCQSFAQRGFIAISAEYRTGNMIVPGKYGNYFSVQQVLAMWRAGQEARGALRSIIKRERNGKEPYRIDTNNIFVGGKSSGAFLAMNLAFYNQTSLLNTAFSGLDSSAYLGQINQNYYLGGTDINYKIKGILDMWGAVFVPQTTDSAFLKSPENFFFTEDNRMPPLIAFQGMKDKAFNYRYDIMEYPPATVANGIYTTESYCLNTATTFNPNTPNKPDGWVLGAQTLYDMYRRKKTPVELYLDCDMGHGLELNGDFGLQNRKTDTVLNYIVQRACTFFQAVSNGIADSLTTTRFISCQNFRYGCSKADNNNNCQDNDNCSGRTLLITKDIRLTDKKEAVIISK